MGYRTLYNLSIEGPLAAVDKAESELSAMSSDAKTAVELGVVYSKWYDCVKECSTVAKNNPDVLIILAGDGDEWGDMWERRWKGTEYEMQKWICPSFTNENLQTKYEKDNS